MEEKQEKKPMTVNPNTAVRCRSSLTCPGYTTQRHHECFLFSVFLAYLWLVVYSYYQQLRKSTVHGHQGFIQTVLTMAENGEDCMSHDKFMACEKCDVAAGTDTFRTENN
jgi:hypothetical protein